MDHVWSLFDAIFIHKCHAESFRKVEVELYSRELPLSTDGIFDLQVDLRTIECSATFIDIILEAFFLNSLLQCFCCSIPLLNLTYALFRLGGDVCVDIVEAEGMEHME